MRECWKSMMKRCYDNLSRLCHLPGGSSLPLVMSRDLILDNYISTVFQGLDKANSKKLYGFTDPEEEHY